ncbi:MAG: hypothetical protein V3S20_05705 [Dehalococcoidia bacterium]
MAQHVYAHVSEMIFGSQYPHVDVAQRYELRPLVDVIQRGAVEFRETLVQIDHDRLGRRSGKCSQRDCMLFRWHTQVDVAIRSQPAFGVQPRYCPTLDQQRLHAG